MDGRNQVRSASELFAERVMERVLDLVVQSIDVDALAQQVDVDALLRQVDVNRLVQRVDMNAVIEKVAVNALLDQVDINHLIARVDIDAIVRQTDLGAVVSMSSGHVAGRAVDIVRAQGVELDRLIDRWVRRLLRRKDPGLVAPPTLRNAEAVT